MKLLHVGQERELADRLGAALLKAGQHVDVTWAGSHSDAMIWLQSNPDIATAIVEDYGLNQSCAGLVRDVRGLEVTAPIIVVSMAGVVPPLAALKAGADDYVVKGESLFGDLAGLVTRALHRAKSLSAKRPVRCLYLGESTLARECFRNAPQPIEIVEPDGNSTGSETLIPAAASGPGQKLSFDVVLAEHGHPGVDIFAILKDAATRRLQVPIVFVVGLNDELILPALRMGAADYALKTRESFEALSFRLDRVRSGSILLKEFSDLLAQQTELRASLTETTKAHAALELKLADAETTARATSKRHAAMATIAEELQEQQKQSQAALAHALEARDTLARQLQEATTALVNVQQKQASDAALAARLARREQELTAKLDDEAARRGSLEQKLKQTERRASKERQAATRESTQRKADFEARLAQESTAREEIARQLNHVSTTLEETIQARTADAAAAAERLSRREDELSSALVEAEAARDALALRLREAEAALERVERARATEVASLNEHVARRESELQETIEDITAARDGLVARLAEVEERLEHTVQRATTDRDASMRAAAEREAEVQAKFTHDASVRDALEQRLDDVTATLEQTRQERAADAVAAAKRFERREAELTSAIDDITATLATTQQHLSATEAALRQAEQQAADDRHAAATDASHREAEFEARLQRETVARQALEQHIASLETARRDTDERHSEQIANAAAQFTEYQTLSETRLAEMVVARKAIEQRLSEVSAALQTTGQRLTASEAALSQSRQQVLNERQAAAREAKERQAAFDARMVQEAAQQDALERRVAAADDALCQAVARHSADMSAEEDRFATYRTEAEARLAETISARDTFARSLDEAKKAWASEVAAAADRLATREAELLEAIARAMASSDALEARLAERDAQLKEQAVSHMAAQDALQTRTSSHIAQLRRELDETIVMNRSRFERSPVSMLRCSRDGAIEQVSELMAAMLGYRTPQEAESVDFGTAVFESSDDWRSLIDRCLETGAAESLETMWKKKNGARFVVRLRAVPSESGQIDVAAEDLTSYRELEEKLRRSERMEAVGRLASEVAATCDNLLRDVRQDGQTWLEAMSGDSPMRQQGELLLNDVTRAASFLRQLEVYGKTQSESSEPVDLVRVLRSLTPVLKRVAGDDIEFVLPKSSSPLTVDVEVETVERILVNVAAYGRERMPFGGRMMFELATVTVDSQGVATNPDVRPGPHVLITATAVRYAVWSDASRTLPRPSHAPTGSEAASDRPGVDLGAMQALIQGCGGRLWMAAEPPGDMVLKIHLPRSTPSHAAVRAGRHPMRRWLHAGR